MGLIGKLFGIDTEIIGNNSLCRFKLPDWPVTEFKAGDFEPFVLKGEVDASDYLGDKMIYYFRRKDKFFFKNGDRKLKVQVRPSPELDALMTMKRGNTYLVKINYK